MLLLSAPDILRPRCVVRVGLDAQGREVKGRIEHNALERRNAAYSDVGQTRLEIPLGDV